MIKEESYKRVTRENRTYQFCYPFLINQYPELLKVGFSGLFLGNVHKPDIINTVMVVSSHSKILKSKHIYPIEDLLFGKCIAFHLDIEPKFWKLLVESKYELLHTTQTYRQNPNCWLRLNNHEDYLFKNTHGIINNRNYTLQELRLRVEKNFGPIGNNHPLSKIDATREFYNEKAQIKKFKYEF